MDQLDVRFLYVSAIAGMWAGTAAAMSTLASIIERDAQWKTQQWLNEQRAKRQQEEFEFWSSLPKRAADSAEDCP